MCFLLESALQKGNGNSYICKLTVMACMGVQKSEVRTPRSALTLSVHFEKKIVIATSILRWVHESVGKAEMELCQPFLSQLKRKLIVGRS